MIPLLQRKKFRVNRALSACCVGLFGVGSLWIAATMQAQSAPTPAQASTVQASTKTADLPAAPEHKAQKKKVIKTKLQENLFGPQSERWRDYAGPSQAIVEKKEVMASDYVIHQAIELGGHMVSHSGSAAMWDNMVNVSSGPRMLTQSLEMHAIDHKGKLFDDLNMQSFGYGGDPNTTTLLKFSKGRIYTFYSLSRRDRQYFDYDLLDNPLIPATSNPYTPVLNSPHLFNTVRKMGNYNLTLLPFARADVRFGYAPNISEGPTFSTVHEGAEALLNQNWRNGTNTYTAGVDWKMLRKTSVSYDEILTQYKEDTSWSLADLNYQLSNGTPVSLGIDMFTAAGSPCAVPVINATTTPPTISPTCNAYLSYTRVAPTRVLYPTEQLHFESTSVPHVQMTGRIVYSDSNGSLRNYNETFNGYNSRGNVRQSITTGSANTKIIHEAGDYGITWQVVPKVSISDAFNFFDFRDPGNNSLTATTYTGASLLATPVASPKGPATTTFKSFLAQKEKTNTTMLEYSVMRMLRLSAGYRYRSRIITFDGSFTPVGETVTPIHENWGFLGGHFQPYEALIINFSMDAMYADRAYTRISPRQLQDYKIYTTYTPKPWMQLDGAITIQESRDNVTNVQHLQHNRNYSVGATITPSSFWTLDAHYGYTDYFTQTDICYVSTPAYPVGASACPTTTGYLLGNGYYDEPTNFGTIDIGMHPVDRVTTNLGYTASAVDGHTATINPRQVPGSLQSIYETPFANVAVFLTPKWNLKGGWAFNEYGEGSPIGPTLPRSFRGNLFTIGARYSF